MTKIDNEREKNVRSRRQREKKTFLLIIITAKGVMRFHVQC